MADIDNQQDIGPLQSQPSAPAKSDKSSSKMWILIVAAVVIVVAVLGGLAFLFLFSVSPAALPNNFCIADTPFICMNMAMNSNGQLGFTWGQSSGAVEYNIMFACATNATPTGMPNTGHKDPWYYISSTGVASKSAPASSLGLKSGEDVNITQLQCYNATGQQIGGSGKIFAGKLWYNYTTNASSPSASNMWYTSTGASVSVTSS